MWPHSQYLLDTLELERHSLALCCADCGQKLIAWKASEQRSREHLLMNVKHHQQACEGAAK